jgi:DNA-binding SARP family transcriptional activator
MMSSDQNKIFLERTLSRLLPDVFFHPVWIHFARNIADYSPDFVQYLLHDLQLEQTKADLISNCQVMFMCAYMQSRLDDHAAALASIEQAWQLAETHGLRQIACCAAWGASAICVRRGNYQEAVDWLSRLQKKLKEEYEWVLVDTLEVFKQILQGQLSQTNVEFLDWFLRWGELPLVEPMYQSEGEHRTRSGAFPPVVIISRLNQHWRSLWRSLSYKVSSKWFLQDADEIQNRGLLPKPKASQFDEKILSSTSAPFSHNRQMATGVSGLSNPLLQLQNIPSSPLPPSAPKQPELPSLAVYYLGQFQAYQDEQLIENWLSRKGLSVFKYLILEHPTPVGKEILMETFWPDSDPEASRRNLHQAIYSLRRTLRGEQQEFHHIWFKSDCYSINPGIDIWIDFREFEKCISAGRRLDKAGRLDEAIEQYGTAEALYQGDFLEDDPYEDWPILQREQILNSYLNLVDRLSDLYLQYRQYTAVVHLCHKVLAKDRCYEGAHRRLMQCYLAQGQRHLAVRQYQTCVQALREELDIPPSEETVALYSRITSKRDI